MGAYRMYQKYTCSKKLEKNVMSGWSSKSK